MSNAEGIVVAVVAIIVGGTVAVLSRSISNAIIDQRFLPLALQRRGRPILFNDNIRTKVVLVAIRCLGVGMLGVGCFGLVTSV